MRRDTYREMEPAELKKQIVDTAIERLMDAHQVPARQLLAALQKVESVSADHAHAVSELKRVSANHDSTVEQMKSARDDHEMQMLEYSSAVADLVNEVKRLTDITHLKGEPGIAPTLDEVVKALKPHLPKVQQINQQEVIAGLVPFLPKPESPEIMDKDALFDEFITRIKKERPIDVSHIKNAESFLYKLKSGKTVEYKIEELMRGAGAATGGSFSIQIPSGTVNGANRTFVFSTAPNVIVLDNGNFMNRVSSDGTVNWTIVGTTVTLNQAPLFNIYGF